MGRTPRFQLPSRARGSRVRRQASATLQLRWLAVTDSYWPPPWRRPVVRSDRRDLSRTFTTLRSEPGWPYQHQQEAYRHPQIPASWHEIFFHRCGMTGKLARRPLHGGRREEPGVRDLPARRAVWRTPAACSAIRVEHRSGAACRCGSPAIHTVFHGRYRWTGSTDPTGRLRFRAWDGWTGLPIPTM